MYEVLRFKKQNAPATVEVLSVETPVDHSEKKKNDSLKNSVNEVEETLQCMKHEIEQLKSTPVQKLFEVPAQIEELAPIDHNENIALYL